MVAEVETQDLDDAAMMNVPIQPATPVAVLSVQTQTPVKKPLTLDHLKKKIQEKPLVRVEISDLFEGETLVCWRKDNMPAHILEQLRSKSEERNTLKVLLDAVSELTLDEHGQPLGTREMWAQFDLDILNSILHALYESSNKVGEV